PGESREDALSDGKDARTGRSCVVWQRSYRCQSLGKKPQLGRARSRLHLPPGGALGLTFTRRDAIGRAGDSRRGRCGAVVDALHGLPVFPGVQPLARGAALELADDAVLGHEVDQAGGAAVADPQGALEERGGTSALADDDLDGRLVQFVALLQRLALVLAT